MQVGLPRLQEVSDIRKYLLVIETLELEKLHNVLVISKPLREQAQVSEDLASMKAYHKEMTEFLMRKQSEYRSNEFQKAFVCEISKYLEFWERISQNFKAVCRAEIEALIDKNEAFKEEFNELMEKHLEFRPPPQSAFLSLQVIRKLVARLRLNDPIKFIHFDFYQKMNVKLNEDWLRDRRLIIIRKMDQLEKRLADILKALREKLELELQKLHAKRLRQFDQLVTQYTKIKNHLNEVKSKEVIELKKHQIFANNRVAVTTMFHQNDFFQKGMARSEGQPETVLDDLNTQSDIPQSQGIGVTNVRSHTPEPNWKNRGNPRLDRSLNRDSQHQQKSAAVANFNAKNNFFGSDLFLGEMDLAKMAKKGKKKKVKIEGV